MASNRSRTAGRHFLQIPGPSPLPDRVLRAMDMPIIDHRGPEFAQAGAARARRHQDDLQDGQSGRDLPSSGTGAWEAALVNTLSPGDRC
jgi:alanine-glyoxylate transaminase / serine-glyoxylate transaminase / serine-pyruvate transaminase